VIICKFLYTKTNFDLKVGNTEINVEKNY